jgi:hypothetical protein
LLRLRSMQQRHSTKPRGDGGWLKLFDLSVSETRGVLSNAGGVTQVSPARKGWELINGVACKDSEYREFYAAEEEIDPDSISRRILRSAAASSSRLTWLLRNCTRTWNDSSSAR